MWMVHPVKKKKLVLPLEMLGEWKEVSSDGNTRENL